MPGILDTQEKYSTNFSDVLSAESFLPSYVHSRIKTYTPSGVERKEWADLGFDSLNTKIHFSGNAALRVMPVVSCATLWSWQ